MLITHKKFIHLWGCSMTNKEYYEKLFNLESKYKLYNIKFRDKFSVWTAYRNYFESYDLIYKGFYKSSVEVIKPNLNYLINYINLFLRGNIFKLFRKKRDYIVLQHPRSSKNGEDIYTKSIDENLSNILHISFSMGFSNLRDGTIYLDTYKIMAKIASKIILPFLDNKKFTNYRFFLEELDSNEILYKKFKEYYIEFGFMYYFYYLLLSFHKPKVIFSVVYYENVAIVSAAKSLDIPVVEVQHGVIYKYHYGYSYPYDDEKYTNVFPNYIAVFSQYWHKNIPYPKESKLLIFGNDYLSKNKQNFKKENSIVVVSQGIIGNYLTKFISKNIEDLREYKIYFKIHPSEANIWRKNYPILNELSQKYQNLEIISNQRSIAELQDISKYQIGVFSTAIYEGIERDCDTFLLYVNGIEAMESLIVQDLAIAVHPEESLILLLEKNDRKRLVDVTFFEPFSNSFFTNFCREELEINV